MSTVKCTLITILEEMESNLAVTSFEEQDFSVSRSSTHSIWLAFYMEATEFKRPQGVMKGFVLASRA